MKFKMKRDRSSSGRVLLFESDKGDQLDYVEAERLQRGDLSVFLPFIYDKGKKTYRLTYCLDDCASLQELLSKPLAPFQMRSLLSSLLNMVRICEENNLSRLHVAYEPDQVFFDFNTQELRFAYVPLRLFSSSTGEMSMLAYVCETAQVSPYEQALCAAVLDYARRTAVLTSVAFEEFLRAQGLYSSGQSLEGNRVFATDTDKLDTRTSHGWDFVRRAQQDASGESRKDRRHLLVRLASKESFSLADGVYTLGRDADCAIVLANAKGVSRKHARIEVRGDICSIADLNSTNGVFVNGSRVVTDEPMPLKSGDRFALAREEFELL